MSKDFKTEYQEYTAANTPDLWNRIEPKLHEKNISETICLTAKQKRSDRRKVLIIKYSGLVAACICLAIIIPVLFNQGFGRMGSASDSAPRSAEAADTTDTTGTYLMADYAENEYTETAADDCAPEESAPENFTNSMMDSDGACADTTTSGNISEESMVASEEASKGEGTQKRMLYMNVSIKVDSILIVETSEETYYQCTAQFSENIPESISTDSSATDTGSYQILVVSENKISVPEEYLADLEETGLMQDGIPVFKFVYGISE